MFRITDIWPVLLYELCTTNMFTRIQSPLALLRQEYEAAIAPVVVTLMLRLGRSSWQTYLRTIDGHAPLIFAMDILFHHKKYFLICYSIYFAFAIL